MGNSHKSTKPNQQALNSLLDSLRGQSQFLLSILEERILRLIILFERASALKEYETVFENENLEEKIERIEVFGNMLKLSLDGLYAQVLATFEHEGDKDTFRSLRHSISGNT